jgi:hypothetical protein
MTDMIQTLVNLVYYLCEPSGFFYHKEHKENHKVHKEDW